MYSPAHVQRLDDVQVSDEVYAALYQYSAFFLAYTINITLQVLLAGLLTL